jgi:hypothetical protein
VRKKTLRLDRQTRHGTYVAVRSRLVTTWVWTAFALGLVGVQCHREPPQSSVQSSQDSSIAEDLTSRSRIPTTSRLTAEDELRGYLDSLRTSGPATIALSDKARAVTTEWKALTRASGDEIAIGEAECYAAGCATTIEYASRKIFDRVNGTLSKTPALYQWPGRRFRSGLMSASTGQVASTWILYAGPTVGPP